MFLASRINAKMIKINSKSIRTRIKCAQQPSRLKPSFVFLAPRSNAKLHKINSNSIKTRITCAQQPSQHSRLSGTLVFLMFLGVQDPNQGQGLSGLVAPENSLFCCNRVPFSSKNYGFVATGYHFLRKTMVLLQQGTIFLEKQWFCCNILLSRGRVQGWRV